MVKVLAIEGNRIKLSRKALIREQKAKLAQTNPAAAAETEEVAETETQAAPTSARCSRTAPPRV
jgi:polyribonucleotide nucleotidyltransferase